MNIWQFQNAVSQRLLRWGVFSMVAGLLMRFGSPFWKGVGGQFLGWGFVDAIIALFGFVGMRNRVDSLDNPGVAEAKRREERNLGRALWINAGLDVIYILGGFLWMRRDKGNGGARGAGWGVVIQGAFLLVLDVIHALNMPKTKIDE